MLTVARRDRRLFLRALLLFTIRHFELPEEIFGHVLLRNFRDVAFLFGLRFGEHVLKGLHAFGVRVELVQFTRAADQFFSLLLRRWRRWWILANLNFRPLFRSLSAWGFFCEAFLDLAFLADLHLCLLAPAGRRLCVVLVCAAIRVFNAVVFHFVHGHDELATFLQLAVANFQARASVVVCSKFERDRFGFLIVGLEEVLLDLIVDVLGQQYDYNQVEEEQVRAFSAPRSRLFFSAACVVSSSHFTS